MNDYNILDSMAGEKALKESLKIKAYEVSNDLHRIAGIKSIADINKIIDIYTANDYAFMKDPLKYQNLDMKVNGKDNAQDLVVCKVIVGGREMDFMINLSDTNGLNKGDILRIDLDKEGKSNQTIWSDDFLEHTSEKADSLGQAVDAETILAGLGINNYEDIVREVNKRDGFKIDQKKAIEGINKNRGIGGRDVSEEIKEKEDQGANQGEKDKELNIEEIAAEVGVSVSALQQFCEKNGIQKITGVNITNDVDRLAEKLDSNFSSNETPEVLMIRAAGVDGKDNSAFVIDKNGETLYNPGDTPNGEEFLLDVVQEGANGGEIQDVAEAAEETNQIKIGESDNGISIETSQIKGKNISENSKNELELEIEKLMEKLNNDIEIIKDGPGTSLEKAKMIEERCVNAHTEGQLLQEKYGVDLPGLTDKTLDIANDAVAKTEKEEIKEGLFTVGEVAIGAVAAATGIRMGLNNDDKAYDSDDEGYDPRDPRSGGPRPH